MQAEQLVQMICYPGGLPSVQLGDDDDDDDDEPKQRYQIARILHSVDQWSQRVSWLELQLMIKQALTSVSAIGRMSYFLISDFDKFCLSFYVSVIFLAGHRKPVCQSIGVIN